MNVLCMLFGITNSICSTYIRFSRRLLVKVLSKDLNVKVKMPTEAEVVLFKLKIGQKYSALTDVYAVEDGVKLMLEQSGDVHIQERYYNGWTHGHYAGNVLVFAPNGCIIYCVLNAPGNMHDSKIADWGVAQNAAPHGVTCI